jgi:CheY-like chemotaxis protein
VGNPSSIANAGASAGFAAGRRPAGCEPVAGGPRENTLRRDDRELSQSKPSVGERAGRLNSLDSMIERTYRVLVADDDDSVRESLRKLLHGEGYQVLSVSNGAKAVEIFRRELDRIDLLLLDLNMPLRNGWATLDRLIEIKPALPVIIITGQPNQYEMAEAAGVRALVEKPIDVPALLQVIHKLLAASTEPRELRPGQREFVFYYLRPAGYASRVSWRNENVAPYSHGGLNE